MTFRYNRYKIFVFTAIFFFKEDVKGSKVYNIIIDIYRETKLEQEVGNQLFFLSGKPTIEV